MHFANLSSVILRLVNLATGPPGVKFKKSAMPFVQMENISHFLRACKSPPLGMQDHDVFLTVDLYEQKDPTQVLQCLSSFSRAAHAANPSAFPSAIGPRLISPQDTGRSTPSRNRGFSNVSSTSGRWSPGRSPTNSDRPTSPNVSTWSQKSHEGVTSPAWNIAQYGYLGGASQGNLGIVYGGRRQITSAGPYVPSVKEKERRRKEQEAEALRQKQQIEEQEHRRKAELEADEEQQARLEEEQKWDVETARQRAHVKIKAEEEKRQWEEQERQWKLTEQKRRKAEEEAEAQIMEERRRAKSQSDARLQGQYLSQYQAENGISPQGTGSGTDAYLGRMKHLDKDIESAREREKQYEEERSRRSPHKRAESRARHRSRTRPPSRQDSWSRNDDSPRGRNPSVPPSPRGRDHSVAPVARGRDQSTAPVARGRDQSSAPAPRGRDQSTAPVSQGRDQSLAPAPRGRDHSVVPAPRPLPIPIAQQVTPHRSSPLRPQRTGESRPLPIPGPLATTMTISRTSTPSPPPPEMQMPRRPLPNPTPTPTAPVTTTPPAAPLSSPSPPLSPSVKAAIAAANTMHHAAQATPSPPPLGRPKRLSVGFSSRTLLEREMEMERQRQREWEEQQAETSKAPRAPEDVEGVGGRWDVNQWSGFTGGDSQNSARGAQGIGGGGGRRQIVGPRPLPGRP